MFKEYGAEIPLGIHVQAQWRNGGYYGATISQAQNGQYLAVWDDGDTPAWVTADQIQMDGRQAVQPAGPVAVGPGTHCTAIWADGQPYGATVQQFDGQQYQVAWDGGWPPSWVFPMNISPDTQGAGVLAGVIPEGTPVMAQWTNGSYYGARVAQFNGSQYLVMWDDGSAPLWVAPEQIQMGK